MNLALLPNTFAICRLAADAPIPSWATGDFISITRTDGELSIVCPQDHVPDDVKAERGWRCLRVAGTLDLSQVGVLSALAGPLFEAGISIFVISTFDTDYLMVRETNVERTIAVLGEAGNEVGKPCTSVEPNHPQAVVSLGDSHNSGDNDRTP